MTFWKRFLNFFSITRTSISLETILATEGNLLGNEFTLGVSNTTFPSRVFYSVLWYFWYFLCLNLSVYISVFVLIWCIQRNFKIIFVLRLFFLMGVKDKRKDSCNICIKQYSVTSVIIGFTLNVTQLHLVGTINFVKRTTTNFFLHQML